MYFDQKEFGKRLHTQRNAREMTQEELAFALGLASKQHISRIWCENLINGAFS